MNNVTKRKIDKNFKRYGKNCLYTKMLKDTKIYFTQKVTN